MNALTTHIVKGIFPAVYSNSKGIAVLSKRKAENPIYKGIRFTRRGTIIMTINALKIFSFPGNLVFEKANAATEPIDVANNTARAENMMLFRKKIINVLSNKIFLYESICGFSGNNPGGYLSTSELGLNPVIAVHRMGIRMNKAIAPIMM